MTFPYLDPNDTIHKSERKVEHNFHYLRHNAMKLRLRTVPQSEENVISCHPLWGNSRHCSPSWVPGPNMIPDPRGSPPPPLSDQSPFSARRRSIVTRGGIIIKPPGVFSIRHPGCRNGKKLVKVRTACRCMTRLPTRETHHV